MIKTYEELSKMTESQQKNAWYELHFLNKELNKQGLKCEILRISADYTYHIALIIVDIDRINYCWYSATNDGGKMFYFKNWAECFNFINGMRMVFYNGLNK